MIVVYEDSIGKETEFFPESYVKLKDVLRIINKEKMFVEKVKNHTYEKAVEYECIGKIKVLNTIAQQVIDLKISEDTLRKELNNDFCNS
jgi:hypothetical protein